MVMFFVFYYLRIVGFVFCGCLWVRSIIGVVILNYSIWGKGFILKLMLYNESFYVRMLFNNYKIILMIYILIDVEYWFN